MFYLNPNFTVFDLQMSVFLETFDLFCKSVPLNTLEQQGMPLEVSASNLRNALIMRLLKTLRQGTAGFALLGAHQIGAVPKFPSTICST
ncbi:hypothetical protein T265_02285 [Opisthorchis viverrini]|uniref:Uncharacterized protein n=1 Tax=Opisthorchis viverrini TaxID=6198 RepID=A0A074ZVL6_OPIVI|nr:hypothetical protein T265_02285 [Opisthorchis viverrini]KER31518.1 hypothetical protein T265_02285 [Opisthorchis viverrini]